MHPSSNFITIYLPIHPSVYPYQSAYPSLPSSPKGKRLTGIFPLFSVTPPYLSIFLYNLSVAAADMRQSIFSSVEWMDGCIRTVHTHTHAHTLYIHGEDETICGIAMHLIFRFKQQDIPGTTLPWVPLRYSIGNSVYAVFASVYVSTFFSCLRLSGLPVPLWVILYKRLAFCGRRGCCFFRPFVPPT